MMMTKTQNPWIAALTSGEKKVSILGHQTLCALSAYASGISRRRKIRSLSGVVFTGSFMGAKGLIERKGTPAPCKAGCGSYFIFGRSGKTGTRPGTEQTGNKIASPPCVRKQHGLPETIRKCYGEHHTKTHVVVPIVRMIPVANRTAGVIWIVVPGAAAGAVSSLWYLAVFSKPLQLISD